MRVSLIAAVSENGVIGRHGELPWRLSNDLRQFKQLTMSHTVIMGRRTWESIARPLPGRRMVVVSRRPEFHVADPDVQVVNSLDEALRVADSANDVEAFVIGGAELYRAALSVANRLYLTRVHAQVDGDTFFPELSWKDWQLVDSRAFAADQNNDHPHTLEILDRIP